MKLFFIISRLSVCLEAGVIALQGYPSSVFRQAVEMNNVLPEIAPLFEKTLPLLQCLISCIALPSCLSVFASKQGETCKGYQFAHRHKTGINFLHVEGVTYYAKGRFSIGKMSKYFQLLFFLYLDYLIYKIKYCVEKKSILFERSQHNLYPNVQFEYIYQKH